MYDRFYLFEICLYKITPKNKTKLFCVCLSVWELLQSYKKWNLAVMIAHDDALVYDMNIYIYMIIYIQYI